MIIRIYTYNIYKNLTYTHRCISRRLSISNITSEEFSLLPLGDPSSSSSESVSSSKGTVKEECFFVVLKA